MIARDRSMSYSGAAAGRDLAHCAGGMKSEQRPPDNGTSATTAAILVVTVKKSLWTTSSHDHDGLHLHRYMLTSGTLLVCLRLRPQTATQTQAPSI